jgi:hypothetical protein
MNTTIMETVDFASFALPERRAMKDAKAAIVARRVVSQPTYTQSGPWLKIHMPRGSDLFLCPATGSLRWHGGAIFSSQGLPRALQLMDEYRAS